MPIPSSAAFSRADHLDREAVLLGDGARLAGEDFGRDVVGRPVGQAAGQVGALADDRRRARRPARAAAGRLPGAPGSARRAPAAARMPHQLAAVDARPARSCPPRRRGPTSSAAASSHRPGWRPAAPSQIARRRPCARPGGARSSAPRRTATSRSRPAAGPGRVASSRPAGSSPAAARTVAYRSDRSSRKPAST